MLQIRTRIVSCRPRYGSSSLSRITVYPMFVQGIATSIAVTAWRRMGISIWPGSTSKILPETYAERNNNTTAVKTRVSVIPENDSSLKTIGAVGMWPTSDEAAVSVGS